ncbi:sodium:calcium antiporter [Candidatus Bipolaricaulota bacterium]|nr:sodium:calcium antiporter [Candidatus Bipolaricaulota bacterium]
MLIQWVIFLGCSAAIVLAGTRLANYGDTIGKKTGIGQGWIGLLLLATVTSIPELTTTVTGAWLGTPNIAVGNAFGSNLFNIVIIAVLDIFLLRRDTVLSRVRPHHVASGGLAILLTAIAMLGIVLDWPGTWGSVSPFSFLILITYVAGVYLLYRVERDADQQDHRDSASDSSMSLRAAIIGFAVCSSVIIAAGVFLISSAKELSEMTGISASVMGSVLVAVVTSLPELATSFGALRIGAFDMILGNLFGSNMFNILTIFFADVAFRGGSILTGLGDGAADQLLVALFGLLLTGIAVVAIAVRPKRRVLGIGVESLVLLTTYAMGLALILLRGISL